MTLDEIIRNLEDQAGDRESFVDKDDPDCIFRRDAQALREAANLLEDLTGKATERDAAVADLESACASLPVYVACQYCKKYPCSEKIRDECNDGDECDDGLSQFEWRGKGGGTPK